MQQGGLLDCTPVKVADFPSSEYVMPTKVLVVKGQAE